MDELISRQAAIDALEFGITYAKVFNKETGEVRELFSEANEELRKAVERIKQLPSAQREFNTALYADGFTDGYKQGKKDAQQDIIRCKDCKHSRFFDPCFYCYEFGGEIIVPENGFCFMAKRRTDG